MNAVFAQGPLTPPGAPAPGMRTLLQIEPRTPISSLPFSITNSGSYYLTTNLTGVSGTNGITVTANNVTLDLGGFTLTGVPGANDGIFLPGPTQWFNFSLKDGTLTAWPTNGVDADVAHDSHFVDITVTSNGVDGLNPGQGATLSHCIADDNGLEGFGGNLDYNCTFESCTAGGSGDSGFFVYSYSVFKDCIAQNNINDGFNLDFQCLVDDCNATGNSADGFDLNFTGCQADHCVADFNGRGIVVADHCSVRDSTASLNSGEGIIAGWGSLVATSSSGLNGDAGIRAGNDCVITDCTTHSNTSPGVVGIIVGDGSTVKGCNSAGNTANGIQAGNGCLLEDNILTANGLGLSTGGGLVCLGGWNRVDGNHFIANLPNGLYLAGGTNTVVRNSAKGNATNYSVGSGNDVAPIGSAATSTSPWANLQ